MNESLACHVGRPAKYSQYIMIRVWWSVPRPREVVDVQLCTLSLADCGRPVGSRGVSVARSISCVTQIGRTKKTDKGKKKESKRERVSFSN